MSQLPNSSQELNDLPDLLHAIHRSWGGIHLVVVGPEEKRLEIVKTLLERLSREVVVRPLTKGGMTLDEETLIPPDPPGLLLLLHALDPVKERPLLRRLNIFRERLGAPRVHTLLWLQDSEALLALVRAAPDLWAHRRRVYDMVQPLEPEPVPTPSAAPLPNEHIITPERSTPSIQERPSLVSIGASNLHQVPLLRHWVRPAPPRLPRPAVRRARDMDALRGLLALKKNATIQGEPGMGKTVMANALALEADQDYPCGVIWETLGPSIEHPYHANPILNRWASHVFGLRQEGGYQFEPDAVRAILSRRGPLLVVLDDVWHVDAIGPLLDALPEGAHRLVTTRFPEVAQALGPVHALGGLTVEEARELIALRLGSLKEDAWAWMDALAGSLGYHPLALDVAAATLSRLEPAARPAEALRLAALPLEGRERTFKASYDALDEGAQRAFRHLGVMAPEAEIPLGTVAAMLEGDTTTARRHLDHLVGSGLLTVIEEFGPPTLWRQHALLRAYALMLLGEAGEEEVAGGRYASYYNGLMGEADEAQRYYRMLPAMAHLRQAFDWAMAHDLDLALNLLNNCANLQGAFSMAREGLQWCERALEAVRLHGPSERLARAWNSLGNALNYVAPLPGEDRRGRLLAALEAYTEVLRFFRPESAPLSYATIQNNRGVALGEIAALPGEDRRERLLAALEAYTEALRFFRPETTPLDYAMTQNNRGATLNDIAALAGEDRRGRLLASLEAYTEALCFFRPESAPLDYAMAQNNRGNTLSDLAPLAGEDRRERLLASLEAFTEALRFHRPETAPLDYAMTQNNRGITLNDLAALAGEDRRERLLAALEAYTEALRFRRPETAPLGYARTQGNRSITLNDIADLPGEDRQARLIEALQAAWEAHRIFDELQHEPYRQASQDRLRRIKAAAGEAFPSLWQALHVGPPPEWLEGEGGPHGR